MLKDYAKAKIMDLYGKETGIELEVNWNPKDEKTNDCKVLRLKTPEGKEFFVKKEEFLVFLFTIGNPEEQAKMVPQKLTKSKWYETILSVKATKDIRKGENITFPIKISLPAVEEEIIGEIKKNYQQKSNLYILLPK